MGADRTLVDAAFKEATSRASGDVLNMKPMYDSNVANSSKAFKVIDSAMNKYIAKKELSRAGVRKQMAGFQAQADAGVKNMYAQDEPMPDIFMNAFQKKITDLQEEFELYNTYGKGDTSENSQARARIMGELKRVTNKATNFRAGTEIFLDSIDNINEGEVNAKDIAGSQQALDFANYAKLVREGKISKVEYGENGIEITSKGYYSDASGSWGEEVVSLASLKAKFPQKNLKHHAQIFKTRNDYVAQGEIAANKTNPENDYNEKEANEAFTKQVNTEEKFKNVVSSRIDGLSESSFKVNLEKNLQIPLSVLENMYYTEDGSRVEIGQVYKDLNLVDDGVIDEKDIAAGKGNTAFEQNLDSLIDALTNVDNPAFDIGLSAPMLGGYLGEIAKSDYEEMFNKTTKANEPKKSDRDGLTNSYGFRTYGQLQGIWNLINAGGEIIKGPDGTRWLDQGNGTWKHDSSDVILDKNGLKDQFELNHLPNFEAANNDLPPVVNTIAESDLTFDIFKGSASAAYDKLNALKYNGINYSTMTTSFMGINKKTEDNIKVFSGDNEIILDFSRDGEESARVQLEKLNAFIEQHRKK